jgi:hypothetical protein
VAQSGRFINTAAVSFQSLVARRTAFPLLWRADATVYHHWGAGIKILACYRCWCFRDLNIRAETVETRRDGVGNRGNPGSDLNGLGCCVPLVKREQEVDRAEHEHMIVIMIVASTSMAPLLSRAKRRIIIALLTQVQ